LREIQSKAAGPKLAEPKTMFFAFLALTRFVSGKGGPSEVPIPHLFPFVSPGLEIARTTMKNSA